MNDLHTLRCSAVALAASLLLCGGCNFGSAPGEYGASFPKRAPKVDDWPAIPYRAQAPDEHARTRGRDDPRVGEVERALADRHGERFIVTGVSDETYSAPGWPGGPAGRYLAYPEAKPALLFGGILAQELIDNYSCIRAVQPLIEWVESVEQQPSTRTLAVQHQCERSAHMPARIQLWLFDDSGRSPAQLAEQLELELAAPLAAPAAQALESLSVMISSHPPGSGPTLRKLLSTTRRAEQARHALRRRERASASLHWHSGEWSLSPEPAQRAVEIERQVHSKVAAHAPSNVDFEVRIPGDPGASLATLAPASGKRQAAYVHVRVNGDYEAQSLADWVFAAQTAVDPRLLLYWELSLCAADAGVPWAEPEQCSAGWDSFTLFTLDDAREGGDFWPYPPPATR